MDEILFPALIGLIGSAGLSETITRALLGYLRGRIKADPAAAQRLAWLGAVTLVAVVGLAALIAVLYFYADTIVAALLDLVSRPSAADRILLTLSGVAVGGLLFLFRKYARVGYGALEVLVAIIGIAGYPSGPGAGGIPWLISLLGLIYILVRGLDNIDVGIQARRARPAVAAAQAATVAEPIAEPPPAPPRR